MKTSKIVDVLLDFHSGSISSREAVEILSGATPYDLYMAECDLFFDKDMKKGDIRDISKLYLQLIKGKTKRNISELEDDHPVRVLMEEHERVKSLLLILENLLRKVRGGFSGKDRTTFLNIMDNLDTFEKHIDREEQVLFKRLSEKKSPGATSLLKSEHRDIIKQIEDIRMPWDDETEDLDNTRESIEELVYQMRMHTFVENDMFYPLAIESLDDWDKIKEECDVIGYCDFKAV